jgi:hypothetical protein
MVKCGHRSEEGRPGQAAFGADDLEVLLPGSSRNYV